MDLQYFEDKEFDSIQFATAPMQKGEYDSCVFRHCNLESADLSGMAFNDCSFIDCNLSLAKLTKTAFRKVIFRDCKMLGLHFENCTPFGLEFTFEHCILNHGSFYELNISKTNFRYCSLVEVEFTRAQLKGTTFDECDLLNAHFEDTNLEKADLRTSFHYSIHPALNKMTGAKFSFPEAKSLLEVFKIVVE